ncbi:hypothetical protein HAHE_07640 [Haloferula helveola]|uniref:Type IV pilus assembly protein PilM n=1 Tax=Haloferula helveola TaxID=490095 RepID=A0ABN6GZZ6_9BACT|nr:hypothetical protein HAHE_07640 [Haloferula helveola]
MGVEIGYDTIHLVLLKRSAGGQVHFEKCQAFEYDANAELESSAFVSTLKGALKQFCGSLKDISIWAAPKLGGANVHHIKIPQVNPAGLPGAVYWGLQREDPFLEEETAVDFQVEHGEQFDKSLNVTGALVERRKVDGLRRTFAHAGYPLSGIGLSLFALRNVVNLGNRETPKTPVMICQMGEHATSVSVLLDRRLVFTRNIPGGLEILAEALVKDLDPTPSYEEACELVLKLGLGEEGLSADDKRRLKSSMELLGPVLERTVRQIERTVQYYQSNFDGEPLETVYFGGSIAARGKLFDYISQGLPLEVIAIDPFDAPEIETDASLPADTAERVAYGPAFGLALEAGQDGINLAQTYKDRQNEGKQRKAATLVTILLLLVTAGTAIFYGLQRLELRSLNGKRDGLAWNLEQLGPRLDAASIKKESEEVRAIQERRRAATSRYEAPALLSEVTRLTPENISLLHVSAAMDSSVMLLDASGEDDKEEKTVAEAEDSMLLKGVVKGDRTSLETALTIYVARLAQSGIFQSVEVESTELVESADELLLAFTLNVKTADDSNKEVTKR